MLADPTALTALAHASPAAVAAHDKDAWLALFARRHIVEDPVGGRPVLGGLVDRRTGRRGDAPLSRFWDTFIAPNDIRFHVERDDIVDGLTVVRDVTIETRLGRGVVARAPMHLLYEATLDDGEPRIRRIAAHWEVAPMFAQVAGIDPARVRVGASMAVRMLRNLGAGGALAFGAAVRSVGERGKTAVRDLVRASNAGDPAALGILGGRTVDGLTKIIAAGDAVTASCTVDGAPAVLCCYLDRRTHRIIRADIYA